MSAVLQVDEELSQLDDRLLARADVGHDLAAVEHHKPVRHLYDDNPALTAETAFRNATLQAAYFMLALRAVGLDVGPMSGFDKAKVDAEFFPNGRLKANFLLNVGQGDPSKLFHRLPRLEWDEVAEIL